MYRYPSTLAWSPGPKIGTTSVPKVTEGGERGPEVGEQLWYAVHREQVVGDEGVVDEPVAVRVVQLVQERVQQAAAVLGVCPGRVAVDAAVRADSVLQVPAGIGVEQRLGGREAQPRPVPQAAGDLGGPVVQVRPEELVHKGRARRGRVVVLQRRDHLRDQLVERLGQRRLAGVGDQHQRVDLVLQLEEAVDDRAATALCGQPFVAGGGFADKRFGDGQGGRGHRHDMEWTLAEREAVRPDQLAGLESVGQEAARYAGERVAAGVGHQGGEQRARRGGRVAREGLDQYLVDEVDRGVEGAAGRGVVADVAVGEQAALGVVVEPRGGVARVRLDH